MSDLRGRRGRNLQGVFLQVSGKDDDLDTYLDRLDFVPGCLVQGRADTTEGQGVLFIQARASTVQHLSAMALEDKLAVMV